MTWFVAAASAGVSVLLFSVAWWARYLTVWRSREDVAAEFIAERGDS